MSIQSAQPATVHADPMSETLQNCAGDAIPSAGDPSAVPETENAADGPFCEPDDDSGPLLPGASATYSPEDNKLRLYPLSRLSSELYARVKAAGFKWAPKQELFVAPGWTPNREDLLLELCGEIGDEDYSPEERAADRAERFSGYRDKRRDEAGGLADTFDAGPSVFGHQNRGRAERQAARHDRYRVRSVSQWSKAEYWQQRTEGVISHALYKSSAKVRRGRILTLEAEQRKHEKSREEYAERFRQWGRVSLLDGATVAVREVRTSSFIGMPADASLAYRLAYALANSAHCWSDYKHPRTGREASIYSLLTDAQDPITPGEAAALWLDGRDDPADPDSSAARWSDHYNLRLAYERAMLAEEGGMVSEADMVPGGWIRGGRTGHCLEHADAGWKQIQKVNKSPATGRVTSVQVWGTWTGYTAESGHKEQATKPALVTINVERLGESAYRAPTPEELEAFKAETAERKAEANAKKPKATPLINPTNEDAERLQALWNIHAAELFAKGRHYGEYQPTAVAYMTQAEYSERSKGSYSSFETVAVLANGREPRRWHDYDKPADKSPVAFKIRKRYPLGNNFSHAAQCVIVLTDKPQKPLPLDWDAVEKPAEELATV